jgi:TolB-like protein/class 3 adenylate cyclase/Flp pilus assembly protein TadD
MTKERAQRHLAAILAADVVGYSRLMEKDEATTFERLRLHRRELFEPEITKHHGRIFKLMGDGLLAEFGSVVDAVECAVVLQKGMDGRNADVAKDHRIDIRIGINLGDVIVEGEDRHGQGINIAARLQQLAEPGGIAVTRTVVEQVKNKLPLRFESLGDHQVKNIAELVAVYRLLVDPFAAGKATHPSSFWRHWRGRTVAAALAAVLVASGLAWLISGRSEFATASMDKMAFALPERPSIAVLPFANMSGDARQGAIVDGITMDLVTGLGRLSGLFVIGSNTTFNYKGKEVTIAEVAEANGVRHVLTGSMQISGEQVRINAELIDAIKGNVDWSDRFDGSLSNIFALQDKVTQSIVRALEVKLLPSEQLAQLAKETTVSAAYEAFLRGMEHYRLTTAEDYAKAIPYFEEAVRLDPSYTRAHAALAMVYARSAARGYVYALGISKSEAILRARRYLKAAEKRPTALYYQAAGQLLFSVDLFDKALIEFQKAIALDPGEPWNYVLVGRALIAKGQPAEAEQQIRLGMRLDPNYPETFLLFLGQALLGAERYQEAASALEKASKLNPEDDAVFAFLGAIYGLLGRKDDAKLAIAHFNKLWVERGSVPLTLTDVHDFYGSTRLTDQDRLLKGFRLAGVPESLDSGDFAQQNRLTAAEVRQLFLGHRLRGRSLGSGLERSAVIEKDSRATISGDWGNFAGGMIDFKGDQVCLYKNYCGSVFRNPGGPRTKENEYIWFDRSTAYTFSQIE